MKIAIHHTPGTFSDRWIDYCKINNVPYKLVNAYDTNIIAQVKDCDVFMWHHHHADYRDTLFAKQLLYSLQMAGKKVFPDFNTGWHFDDKVGQKYMLEAIGAPLVPSHVFYSKQEAIDWVEQTSFPKVFKLRGGAGAVNVKLVYTKRQAKCLIRKAFGKGFPQFDRWNNLKERLKKFRSGKDSFLGVCKGIGRLFVLTDFAKMHSPEKGYVYFQDYIPDNKFDIRVIVVSDKVFALKRMCRENDFRASGSGNIKYNPNEIDSRCVQKSLEIARRLNNSCMAYDWVFDNENTPLIIEVSYGFDVHSYDFCRGYWDKDLNWHEGKFIPQNWMVENEINRYDDKKIV